MFYHIINLASRPTDISHIFGYPCIRVMAKNMHSNYVGAINNSVRGFVQTTNLCASFSFVTYASCTRRTTIQRNHAKTIRFMIHHHRTVIRRKQHYSFKWKFSASFQTLLMKIRTNYLPSHTKYRSVFIIYRCQTKPGIGIELVSTIKGEIRDF